METRTLETEVCVIGGGPAGATIARRLAMLGHEVCLIEKSSFPRRHVGESLPPGILPLFVFLGLRQRIEEASFLRPSGAIVHWAGAQRQLDYTPGALGFQVDRARFDQLLLDAAKEAGVRVVQPAQAGRPKRAGESLWHIPVKCGNDLFTVRARFLVDASGRRRASAGRPTLTATPTLALYAYWRNVRLEGAETRVEAGSSEWFWGAPLPDRTFNATVFIDPSRCRGVVDGSNLENFYLSLLAGSTLLRGCLDGELTDRVSACDATTYLVEHSATPNSIRVGEANLAIDPLSSQGVQSAIGSAVQGSIVVHTILTCPENTSGALAFYHQRQTELSEQHKRIAGQYYSEQASVSSQSFWHERAGDISKEPEPTSQFTPATVTLAFDENSRFRVSQAVRFEQTPCISGDIIRNATTIAHPGLARPVAFINDIEIARLLRLIDSEKTGAEILRLWSAYAPPKTVREILNWMSSSGVLLQVDN